MKLDKIKGDITTIEYDKLTGIEYDFIFSIINKCISSNDSFFILSKKVSPQNYVKICFIGRHIIRDLIEVTYSNKKIINDELDNIVNMVKIGDKEKVINAYKENIDSYDVRIRKLTNIYDKIEYELKYEGYH